MTVTVSKVGFTVMNTFPVALRPVTELFALTEIDIVLGADNGGTMGAANFCCAPLVPDTGTSVTPEGATQV